MLKSSWGGIWIKAKDIILNAYKREKEKKGRGLRVYKPNPIRGKGHLNKARHNLAVASDLRKLGHTDWTLVASYYSMYHGALAVLHRIGLDSKEHAATASVLEYFFTTSGKLDESFIQRFNDVKEMVSVIEEGRAVTFERQVIDAFWRAKQARERAQYGIETRFGEKTVDSVVKTTVDFVSEMEILISELDENDDYVKGIQKKIRKLLT